MAVLRERIEDLVLMSMFGFDSRTGGKLFDAFVPCVATAMS